MTMKINSLASICRYLCSGSYKLRHSKGSLWQFTYPLTKSLSKYSKLAMSIVFKMQAESPIFQTLRTWAQFLALPPIPAFC